MKGILYWYIVVWRNKDFIRTKYKPQKVGDIIGTKEPYQNRIRIGFNNKKGDYKAVNRYTLIKRCTLKEFKEFINNDEA